MKRFMVILAMCVLVLGGMACSSNGPTGENDNQNQNNGNQTNDVGFDADTDVENGNNQDADACTPRTECEEWECGEVDDECGDTLDCGECGCVDGVAQTTMCGGCGIGVLTCEDGETGAGTCDAPEIPGFEGVCDELVWVSQREGSSQGLGTKEDPVDTLEAGLSVARSSDAVAVILGGGDDVTYDGPVLLEERISIVGGYDDDLMRDEEKEPGITSGTAPEGFEDGDVVGVAVHGVTQSVVLSNLTVETEDVEAYGRNNYGMYVDGSPGLRVENVEVVAGRGGDGKDGENGASGAAGEDGSDAMEVLEIPWQESYDVSDLQEGFGGENDACPDAAGGDGGFGQGGGNAGNPDPEDGESGAVASGGEAGEPGGELGDAAGEDGEDAPSVTSTGDHGAGGSSVGEVVDGLWVADGDGGDGEHGEDGTGGGGGGGAGAHEEWSTERPMAQASFGGGGGAGGCGGDGGEGGQGGGGSFGLFVVDGDIEVISSGFFANLGGDGGAGGIGGVGGQGGLGGVPSKAVGTDWGSDDDWYEFEYEDGELGGYGGEGAAGGKGGDGGGGAGGVSYGAYCRGAEVDTSGTVRFSDAGSASGGTSGGLTGDSGTAVDEDGCR